MDSDSEKGPHLPVGTRISFYEVLPAELDAKGETVRTCVGYGGFGALYRVSRGSKIYALKLAHLPLSAYPPAERKSLEERGDREIAALMSLRHPNIVRVHAFDRWPDPDARTFIVMDFVEGDRLDDWRLKHSPSLRKICQVFIAISRALATAHRQDIFHRDLKPANILVRGTDGQPVIVDWGIARPASSYTITRAAQAVGTVTHFAPEYCKFALSVSTVGAPRFQPTPATELHAVGHMLYELLTGEGPFPFGASETETMRNILVMDLANGLRPPRTLNGAVPPELEAIVLRLLEKDPAKRHQTGEELAQDLEQQLAKAGPEWDAPFDVAIAAGEGAPASGGTRNDRRKLPAPSVLDFAVAGTGPPAKPLTLPSLSAAPRPSKWIRRIPRRLRRRRSRRPFRRSSTLPGRRCGRPMPPAASRAWSWWLRPW